MTQPSPFDALVAAVHRLGKTDPGVPVILAADLERVGHGQTADAIRRGPQPTPEENDDDE